MKDESQIIVARFTTAFITQSQSQCYQSSQIQGQGQS